MKWNEFRDFTLVAMITFNICLIYYIGNGMNKNTANVEVLKNRITSMETAVDVGIMQLQRVANDLKTETQRLAGIEPEGKE